MSNNGQANSNENREKSKRILERVEQQSETIGTSSMGRVADRVKDHLVAEDADQESWSEVWGTRIGRGLGLVFFVFLIGYLVKTYVLKV